MTLGITRIDVEGDRFLVRPSLADLATCGRLGGKWDRARQAWMFPATPENAAVLSSSFKVTRTTPDFEAFRAPTSSGAPANGNSGEAALRAATSPDVLPSAPEAEAEFVAPDGIKTRLWRHQIVDTPVLPGTVRRRPAWNPPEPRDGLREVSCCAHAASPPCRAPGFGHLPVARSPGLDFRDLDPPGNRGGRGHAGRQRRQHRRKARTGQAEVEARRNAGRAVHLHRQLRFRVARANRILVRAPAVGCRDCG